MNCIGVLSSSSSSSSPNSLILHRHVFVVPPNVVVLHRVSSFVMSSPPSHVVLRCNASYHVLPSYATILRCITTSVSSFVFFPNVFMVFCIFLVAFYYQVFLHWDCVALTWVTLHPLSLSSVLHNPRFLFLIWVYEFIIFFMIGRCD